MTSSPCICTSLRQAAQSGTALYDAMLAPSGLKVTMFRLLRRIDGAEAEEDTSITGLARRVGLDRSTLGRNLRVLERQGLVRFCEAQDERARHVALTEAGAGALAAALPLWEAAQDRVQAELGADLDGLLALLGRLSRLDAAAGETRT